MTNVVHETVLSKIEPVLLDELDNERGRGGGVVDITTLNKMRVKGNLTDNVAIDNINGFNIIDNGSFTGSHGLISVIQNTGNNVLIQDATILNVTFMP